MRRILRLACHRFNRAFELRPFLLMQLVLILTQNVGPSMGNFEPREESPDHYCMWGFCELCKLFSATFPGCLATIAAAQIAKFSWCSCNCRVASHLARNRRIKEVSLCFLHTHALHTLPDANMGGSGARKSSPRPRESQRGQNPIEV